LKQFYLDNPDYPRWSDTITVDEVHIEVQDEPGLLLQSHGFEYNLDELFHQPISQANLEKIKNLKLRELAEACNARTAQNRFKPYLVNGKTCLWSLRLPLMLKAPNALEVNKLFHGDLMMLKLIARGAIKAGTIMDLSTEMMITEVSKHCGMSRKETERAVRNELNCVTHQDDCGYFYLVPRWAFDLFKQKGYAHKMAASINRMNRKSM